MPDKDLDELYLAMAKLHLSKHGADEHALAVLLRTLGRRVGNESKKITYDISIDACTKISNIPDPEDTKLEYGNGYRAGSEACVRLLKSLKALNVEVS